MIIAFLFSLQCSAECRNVTLQSNIDYQHLWQDFTVLASDAMEGRKPGTSGSIKAQQYIAQQYAAIGLQNFSSTDNYLQDFEMDIFMGSIKGVNVVGWIKGEEFPEQFIVVSAHYDHLGRKGGKIYNGADDNASGVAAMLALASKMQMQGSRHSMVFLATDAEEKGLFGAKAFVRHPPEEISHMKFNLNLDMLSQGGYRHRLYVTGAKRYTQFRPLVDKVVSKAGMCVKLGHTMQLRGRSVTQKINWHNASDHAAFAREGIPYLFVGVADHKYYHTTADTVKNVDPDFYFAAVDTSLLILQNMDKLL